VKLIVQKADPKANVIDVGTIRASGGEYVIEPNTRGETQEGAHEALLEVVVQDLKQFPLKVVLRRYSGSRLWVALEEEGGEA
jgi:hypothetical protein